MKTLIKTLKQMRETSEKSFIENSIIVHVARLDSPTPDTKLYLEMIIDLTQAISVLENYLIVNGLS